MKPVGKCQLELKDLATEIPQVTDVTHHLRVEPANQSSVNNADSSPNIS
jgi:hypothetical protein